MLAAAVRLKRVYFFCVSSDKKRVYPHPTQAKQSSPSTVSYRRELNAGRAVAMVPMEPKSISFNISLVSASTWMPSSPGVSWDTSGT